jgi:hypothetical protein
MICVMLFSILAHTALADYIGPQKASGKGTARAEVITPVTSGSRQFRK